MAYGMEIDGADISSYTYMVMLDKGTRTLQYQDIGYGVYWWIDYFEYPFTPTTASSQSFVFIGNTSGGCVLTQSFILTNYSPPRAIGVRVISDNNTPVTYDYIVMVHPLLCPPPTSGFGALAYDSAGKLTGRLDKPFMNPRSQPFVDAPAYNAYYDYAYGGKYCHSPNGGFRAYYTSSGGGYNLEGVSRRMIGGVARYRWNKYHVVGTQTPNISTRTPLFLSMILD